MAGVSHHLLSGLALVLGLAASFTAQAQTTCGRTNILTVWSALPTPASSGDLGDAFARCSADRAAMPTQLFQIRSNENRPVASTACEIIGTGSTASVSMRATLAPVAFTNPGCLESATASTTVGATRGYALSGFPATCATRPVAYFNRQGDSNICHRGCEYAWSVGVGQQFVNEHVPTGQTCGTVSTETVAPSTTAPTTPPTTTPPVGTAPDASSGHIVNSLAPRIDALAPRVEALQPRLTAIEQAVVGLRPDIQAVRDQVAGARADANTDADRIVSAINGIPAPSVVVNIPADPPADLSPLQPGPSGPEDPPLSSVVETGSASAQLAELDTDGWALSRSCPAYGWPLSFDVGWTTLTIAPAIDLVCNVLAILGWVIGLSGLIQAAFILSRVGGSA